MFFTIFSDACTGAISTAERIFLLPPWYRYLVGTKFMVDENGVCAFTPANLDVRDWTSVITLVALAIIDILLRLAGIVAIAFVFYGGVKYVTSQGEPASTKQALQTIINALIGLAISLVAVALVAFIGSKLGK